MIFGHDELEARHKYENVGLAVLGDYGEQNEDGLDFILDDSNSLRINDLHDIHYYQPKGPGVWHHQAEKSGVAQTIVPAYEVLTETYTEECEEGATKECYESKAHDEQKWYLAGAISSESASKGCFESNGKNELCQYGHSDEYSKACGNTNVLQGLNNELYNEHFDIRQDDNGKWNIMASELEVNFAEDVSDEVRTAVY